MVPNGISSDYGELIIFKVIIYYAGFAAIITLIREIIKDIEDYEGDSILNLAHKNNIDLEGSCEGSLACSTCHVIVDDKFYDQLPPPKQEELDILQLARGVRKNSRLGCQVKISKDIECIKLYLPVI